MAAPTDLADYSFSVEIDGRSLGSFREVSGLAVETTLVEFRDGNSNSTIFLPGATKYSPIRLARAFLGDLALWDWYTTSAQAGHSVRVGGTITVFDRSGQRVAQYTFHQGWPRKYEGPTLNACSNDVPIETIEIAHNGLQLSR